MQIAYHIGANCTDDDRLLKTLLKNAESLSGHGVVVPGPSRYRALIRETIQNLDGAAPADDTREVLMDAILDDSQAERVVMSNWGFICVPARIFENGLFYQLADAKISGLTRLFPNDELELFFALRNPATFIPAVFAKQERFEFSEFLRGLEPQEVRWSSVIERIRRAAPNATLNVWCNEDTPFIWSQLVRELAGIDGRTAIAGGYDLLQTIISEEGLARFKKYLGSHPPQNEVQKRRIIAAFLEKFAIEEEITEEIDAPGWTDEFVEHLTALYDEDCHAIARMPGVNFISP